jgi:hypothetical protein
MILLIQYNACLYIIEIPNCLVFLFHKILMIPQIVDTTAKTGQRILAPVTSWQTPDGPFIVEHLAGL